MTNLWIVPTIMSLTALVWIISRIFLDNYFEKKQDGNKEHKKHN